MDCKSLMIGDWVSCFGSMFQVEAIQSIHPDESVNLKYYGCELVDNIEPIPLTEEILKANGFCKGSYVGGYLHRDFVFRVYPVNSDFLATSIVHEESPIDETIFRCNYVHELQHALRLCGLNELADNFKV